MELMGELPRIELFAREKTEGWDVWGNEVESDIYLEQIKGEGGVRIGIRELGSAKPDQCIRHLE